MHWRETKKPVPLNLNLIKLAEHIYYKEEENNFKTPVAINCNKNISQHWLLKASTEKLLWILINHLQWQAISSYFQND